MALWRQSKKRQKQGDCRDTGTEEHPPSGIEQGGLDSFNSNIQNWKKKYFNVEFSKFLKHPSKVFFSDQT